MTHSWIFDGCNFTIQNYRGREINGICSNGSFIYIPSDRVNSIYVGDNDNDGTIDLIYLVIKYIFMPNGTYITYYVNGTTLF